MAKINVRKDSIVVNITDAKENVRCANLPNAKQIAYGEYEYPYESLMHILGEFYHINDIIELKDRVDRGRMPKLLYDIVMKYHGLTNRTDALKLSGPVFDEESFLFKHQQLCRQIALLNPRYSFFCEAGTGKTPMSLQMIVDDILMHQGEKRRWLVICPLSLIQPAWLSDAATFFPWLKIVSLHGNTPAQTKKAFKEDANIYVINYESFRVKYDDVKALKFVGVIADESSKMKNNTSAITKQLLKFAPLVERWYNLSGTPAPNNMMEYYPQMKAVDPLLLGKSFVSFKSRWFYSYMKGGFPAYDITPESQQALTTMIKEKAIFIAKEDCLDLPEKLFIKREVDMPPDLKLMYDTMRKELYCLIEEQKSTTGEQHMVLAPMMVTSLGKLNQLTSGIIMDENKTVHYVSKAKLDALADLLEEIGNHQVIIWANYRGEFTLIRELLGDDCVTYYGGTNRAEVEPLVERHFGTGMFMYLLASGLSIKDMVVKLFKEGKVKYLVANSASAAHGLTLTNASYAIYYSLNYSYEKWSQSTDRLHRYGQKKACTYYSLLMKDSIDLTLDKVLKNKGDLSQAVLQHLKPAAIGGI